VLKRVTRNSGSNVSTKTVRWELYEMGFHSRAAAHQSKITTHNAKYRLEWCKARHHCNLEQWKCVLWSNESRYTIWQSDGLICVCLDARRLLPAQMDSANCNVWRRRNNGLGLFFMVQARPLSEHCHIHLQYQLNSNTTMRISVEQQGVI
jgi:hypothetical protein